MDFVNQEPTMQTLTVYLEDQRYEDKDFCFQPSAGLKFAGVSAMRELYHALAAISPSLFKPQNQEWHGEADKLEQSLLKARSAVSSAEEEQKWSKPDGPAQWAKEFGFSVDTLMRRFKEGAIRHKKLSSKSYCIHVDDLPK